MGENRSDCRPGRRRDCPHRRDHGRNRTTRADLGQRLGLFNPGGHFRDSFNCLRGCR
ncbi:hypothetical protein D3C76_469770 [compost metagenome]